MKGWTAAVLSLVLLSLYAEPCAGSTSFYFDCITDHDPVSAATAPQFTGTLSLYNSNYVQLTISNAGSGATSSITGIYFDDEAHHLSSMSIINGSGVYYTSGANPSNLPGASNADPAFVTRFSADSYNPYISNGINPGEYISFRFKGDYSTVLQDMTANQLRVGIYVQGFSNGYTESFVSTMAPSPEKAPAPTSLLLTLIGVACIRRHRRREWMHLSGASRSASRMRWRHEPTWAA
jgi:hypothetical protein